MTSGVLRSKKTLHRQGFSSSQPEALNSFPIEGLGYFQKSDYPTFQRLFDYLKSQKIQVSEPLSQINRLTNTFYEFYWAPPQKNTIVYNLKNKKVLNGFGIPHHAFHILCFQKLRHGFKGYPLTLALIEAMCSSLDAYFELSKLQKGFAKPKKPNFARYLRNHFNLYHSENKFISDIEKLSRDPYSSYKKCVRGMFDLMKFMYDHHSEFQTESPQALKNFTRLLKVPGSFLYLDYNYSLFVFYLMGVGGLRSSPGDHQCVQRLLRILDEHHTIESLIDSLSDLSESKKS